MTNFLIVILFTFWALGLFYGVAGSTIHILLLAAVALFAVKLLQGVKTLT